MRTTFKLLSLLLSLAVGSATAMAQDCYVYLKITGTNGWATPTVWAWANPGQVNCNATEDWPGDEMESSGENLYKWTAPAGKTPTNILFSNGKSSVNGDADKTKTGDLVFKNGATYIIDNPDAGSSPSGVKIEGGQNDDDVTDITKLPNYADGNEFFYVYVGDHNWSNLHVWAWNAQAGQNIIPSDEGLSFPGRAMVPVEGFPGYYVWTINNGEVPAKIIVSGNDKDSSEKKIIDEVDYSRGAIYNITGDSPGNFTTDTSHDYSQAPVIGNDTPGNTALGAVTSYAETMHGVKFLCEHGTLELTLYGEGVVKVLSSLNGHSQSERRSITVSALPAGSFDRIADNEDHYLLSTPQMEVKVSKSTGLVSFYAPGNSGSPLLAETTGFYNIAGNVKATFSAPSSNGFYGAGYSGNFNMINHSLPMNNKQTGGWPDNDNSFLHNICIPYVTADNGYGILFDNHYLGSTLRPGKSFTYTSATPDAVAYYYVAGGNARKVLENYTSLTGRQELPPYWALGYITSRYGYKSPEEAISAVNNIRNIDIPVDGLVLDIFWQGDNTNAYGMGRLDWGSLFSNGQEMTRNLLSQGVNTILITEPFFNNSLATTQEMINKGYAADTHVDANSGMSWMCGSSGASLIDVTNPEALEWMWGYYKKLTDQGVTGWWMDLGEPEGYDLNNDTRHKNGTPRQVQNEYGQLWSEGIYNAWKRDFPDMRPFFMPRSGTAGMQRFATFPWTGDIRRSWNGLKVQVPSLLNMSMAGVGYLGCDIGGFSASGNNEALYKRWVGFGCFSPMLRTHVDNANNGQCWAEPYYCSAEGQAQVRYLINMRYSYLPYIYTASYDYTSQGTPMCRPLNFEGDIALKDNTDGYFFGHDIIVAPVVSDNGNSSVTLPATYGTDMERAELWLDITDENAPKGDSDIKHAGETVNFNSVPFDRVPKLARIGSIVPRYGKTSYSNTSELDASEPIYLEVYSRLNVDDVATGHMFEDDHVSTSSISDGKYNDLKFNLYVGTDNLFTIYCDRDNNGLEWEADRPVIVHFPLWRSNYPEVRTDAIYKTRQYSDPVDHVTSATKELFDKATHAQYVDNTGYYIKTVWPKDAPSMRFYTFDSTVTGIGGIGAGNHNPALSFGSDSGKLHVYFTADEDGVTAEVNVIDLMGRSVAATTVTTDSGSNDVIFDVTPGIYIVTVNMDRVSVTGKALVR